MEALLQANGRSDVILDATADMAKTGDFEPITEKAGSQIGPYWLMEQIGEGGFGVVFVSEQQSPVRRKVALKLIKPGMDSRATVGIKAQHIEFSPDGKRLAAFELGSVDYGSPTAGSFGSVGSASKTTVFDVATCEDISSVTVSNFFSSYSTSGNRNNSSGPIWLGFSPDGAWLASIVDATSGSPSLKYWDPTNGRAGLQLDWNADGPIVPAFSADGNRILVLDKSGTIKVWRLRPETPKVESVADLKPSLRPDDRNADTRAGRLTNGSSPDGKWLWSGPFGTALATEPSASTAHSSFVLTINDANGKVPSKNFAMSGLMIQPPTFSSDSKFVATIARDPAAKVEDDLELKVWDLMNHSLRIAIKIPTIEIIPAEVRKRLSTSSAPFSTRFQEPPSGSRFFCGPAKIPVFKVEDQLLLLLPLVVGTFPKQIQAYDLMTGKIRWQIDLQPLMNSPTLK